MPAFGELLPTPSCRRRMMPYPPPDIFTPCRRHAICSRSASPVLMLRQRRAMLLMLLMSCRPRLPLRHVTLMPSRRYRLTT